MIPWKTLAICSATVALLAVVQVIEDHYSARAEVERMTKLGRDAAFRRECLPGLRSEAAFVVYGSDGRMTCVVVQAKGINGIAEVTRVARVAKQGD